MNSKGSNTDPCGTPPLMFPTSVSRPRCQTLSKAFDISQNTVQISSRFSNDKQILW